jgi:hypothetical protein
MSVMQVGLVDTTGSIDPELVQAAAAALNIQVTRDLPQFWNVQATVQYLADHRKMMPRRRARDPGDRTRQIKPRSNSFQSGELAL